MSTVVKWGLYDTKDKSWLGNSDGPLSYDDEELARVAARIIDVRLRWPAGRTEAQPLPPDINKKKDDLTPVISAEVALERLEEGLEL